MQIRGRDLLNGVPKEIDVSQAQVAEALSEPVQQICEAVMTALETTPPDLAADIVDRGVMLTGGGALLGDLGSCALREQTGLGRVDCRRKSLNCVALGTGQGAGIREAACATQLTTTVNASAGFRSHKANSQTRQAADAKDFETWPRERITSVRIIPAPSGRLLAGCPMVLLPDCHLPCLAHRFSPRVERFRNAQVIDRVVP